MLKDFRLKNLTKVIVVSKRSRYSYVMKCGAKKEKNFLENAANAVAKDLLYAHEKNLKCLDKIESVLKELKIEHEIVLRSDLTNFNLENKFIITVGGDGTLLDTSHYCHNSPILGVNSDPKSSIGALCIANANNFLDVLKEIYDEKLKPIALARLFVRVDGKKIGPLVLNDILFCHKNPAAMARFLLIQKNYSESHRSSGIWIATPAGSTGGIYSSGADPLPITQERAIFRQREPYWSDVERPRLLTGFIEKDSLFICSNMMDGKIFIDGSHKSFDIRLGDQIEVSIADQPLWLFDGRRLLDNRKEIIKQRKLIRELY